MTYNTLFSLAVTASLLLCTSCDLTDSNSGSNTQQAQPTDQKSQTDKLNPFRPLIQAKTDLDITGSDYTLSFDNDNECEGAKCIRLKNKYEAARSKLMNLKLRSDYTHTYTSTKKSYYTIDDDGDLSYTTPRFWCSNGVAVPDTNSSRHDEITITDSTLYWSQERCEHDIFKGDQSDLEGSWEFIDKKAVLDDANWCQENQVEIEEVDIYKEERTIEFEEDTFIETVVVEFSCYLEDFLNVPYMQPGIILEDCNSYSYVKNGLKHTKAYDVTDKAFIESMTYTYNNISCTETHETPHNWMSEPECEIDVDLDTLEECYTNLFTAYCKDYPEGYRRCDRYVSM
ncbi:MAG: hypothetical protein OCD01_18930 [Fibrobacterales bacterium]